MDKAGVIGAQDLLSINHKLTIIGSKLNWLKCVKNNYMELEPFIQSAIGYVGSLSYHNLLYRPNPISVTIFQPSCSICRCCAFVVGWLF